MEQIRNPFPLVVRGGQVHGVIRKPSGGSALIISKPADQQTRRQADQQTRRQYRQANQKTSRQAGHSNTTLRALEARWRIGILISILISIVISMIISFNIVSILVSLTKNFKN